MIRPKVTYLALAVSLLFAGADRLHAQTIGYAEALDALAVSCGKDIGRFCRQANLGGGRIADCLERNQANVSPRCKATAFETAQLLRQRAAARAAVISLCELDRLQFCGGIEPGDGNLIECFYKAQRNIRPACRQAIADAGYLAAITAGPVSAQLHLSSTDIVGSLQGAEATPGISADRLRRLAAQAIRDPSRTNRVNRAPLSEQLGTLAQLTLAIQFDFNSAHIRPSSFRAIGLIADSLYHPYLQGYCFLIVGHTDAVGSRDSNLKLSQQRADAIRDAMINPFGIDPRRIEAVGLGEEQLLDRAHPTAAANRRVQLINVGKVRLNTACDARPEVQVR